MKKTTYYCDICGHEVCEGNVSETGDVCDKCRIAPVRKGQLSIDVTPKETAAYAQLLRLFVHDWHWNSGRIAYFSVTPMIQVETPGNSDDTTDVKRLDGLA